MIKRLGLQRVGISPRSVLAAICAWQLLSAVHGAALTTNEAYLFTSFHEPAQDGLRFLYSFDGCHWSNVPGVFLKPNAGQGKLMRDPSLVRGPDGTFHLVWTTAWRGDQGFGHASTKDLVHWSEQQFIPVMTNEPSTVNVWAPEIFYDGNENQFVIAWASTIPGRFPVLTEATNNNHRLYFTTTRDFKAFAPTKLFYDPGFSVIDGFVAKDDGRYVLVHKDNSRSNLCLRVAFGERPTGAWGSASEAFTEKFTEGPSALKAGDEWLIYFDMYRSNRYGAVMTRDFKVFTNVTEEVSFPAGHKHGTALVVEGKVLDYILRVGGEQRPGVRLPFVSKLSPAEIEQRLKKIDEVANRGPYKPDWQSLAGFKTPAWYQDARFGLFLHWGLYSVPAFGSEWYPRNMYRTNSPEAKHHVAVYGPQSKFGYKDFVPLFRAEGFNATEWARLFKQAGAKYVVPVAEHHDGFPMFDCSCTDWNAARMGPKRDVIGELSDALRQEGIVFGASSHRAEHWWFFDQGLSFESDVRDTNNASLYGPASNQRVAENQSETPDKAFLDDWLLRCCEIVDKYQPQLVYFDWWICQPVFQPYLKRFAAYYYNRGAEWKRGVAINFKEWEGRSFPDSTGVFDIERGQSAEIRPELWQTDTSVSRNSWGYITNHVYKEAGDIVDDLIDIASKNGTLLLNIGPKPDGTIAEREKQMLLEIGHWLEINGEAIYGSRPWHKFGEGPTEIVAGSFADVKRKPFTGEDFRFTTKGDALYAIALAWPENGNLVVKSLASTGASPGNSVKQVQLLGYKGKLDWKPSEEGLLVQLPLKAPCDFAVTLRITGTNLTAQK